jgi:hypothetical protein
LEDRMKALSAGKLSVPAAVMILLGSAGASADGEGPREQPRTRTIYSTVITSDDGAVRAAALLNRQLRASLATIPGAVVVDPGRTPSGGHPPCAEAEAMAVRGRSSYENLELDDAVKLLEGAVAAYFNCASKQVSGRGYVEALQFLGAARIARGETDAGMRAFRNAAAFDARATMDTRIFPPDMVAAYARSRDTVAGYPPGAISVTTTPSGTEVFIDGRFSGVSPLMGQKAAPGTHFVSARRDGFEAAGGRLEVESGEEAAFHANMDRSPGLEEFAGYQAGLLSEIDRDTAGPDTMGVARILKADRVIVCSVARRGNAVEAVASAYDMPDGRKAGAASATLHPGGAMFAQEAASFASAVMRPLGKPPVSVVPHKETPVPQQQPAAAQAVAGKNFYETWWFWTIIGGVVVAGATTAGVLLAPSGGGPATGSIGFRY